MQCLAGDYLLRPETLKYTVEKCTLNNPTMKQAVHTFYSLTHFECVNLLIIIQCFHLSSFPTYQDVAGRELRLTALAMLNYGVNRVRGAYWCKAESFGMKNLYSLFPPIAHILGMNDVYLFESFIRMV